MRPTIAATASRSSTKQLYSSSFILSRAVRRVFSSSFELLREVALVGDEGLLADIVGGDVRVARGFGHVYIIAEHLVIPDLELLDAGALTLALLKLGDHLRPVVADTAKPVQLLGIAGAQDAALAHGEGGIVGNGAVYSAHACPPARPWRLCFSAPAR